MKSIKFFVIIAFLVLLSTEVLAEENNDNVQIQLPEFDITINDQKLEDIIYWFYMSKMEQPPIFEDGCSIYCYYLFDLSKKKKY